MYKDFQKRPKIHVCCGYSFLVLAFLPSIPYSISHLEEKTKKTKGHFHSSKKNQIPFHSIPLRLSSPLTNISPKEINPRERVKKFRWLETKKEALGKGKKEKRKLHPMGPTQMEVIPRYLYI
jgi:hypothetical protein